MAAMYIPFKNAPVELDREDEICVGQAHDGHENHRIHEDEHRRPPDLALLQPHVELRRTGGPYSSQMRPATVTGQISPGRSKNNLQADM